MKPTAAKILSVLVELYAKQEGVRIGYTIEQNNERENVNETINQTHKKSANLYQKQKAEPGKLAY